MMHLFSGQSEQSRELLKKLDDRHDAGPQLTLAQVGLGQSRGYLLVRELPDGSSSRRWCILKDERLWFFEAPDSSKAGTSLPLENAVRLAVCNYQPWTCNMSSFVFDVHMLQGDSI